MIRLIAIPLLAITLSGCGLDALQGKKSEAQLHYERQQAALAAPAVATALDVTPPAIVAPVAFVAAVAPPPPPPACVPVLRVTVCVEGVPTDWSPLL